MVEAIDTDLEAGSADAPVNPAWTFTKAEHAREWLRPLRLAAIGALMPEDWPRGREGGLDVVTCCDPRLDAPARGPDAKKHEAYSSHMLSAILEQMPWVLPLLTLTGSSLLVAPGVCSFEIPGDDQLYEISELIPFTHLLPWATAADRQQAQ